MKYYLLIITVFFASCTRGIEKNDILEIEYKNLQEIKLSSYVDNVNIIKLETSLNSIIGEVTKVEIFNEKIYIQDKLSNSLFIFDEKGILIEQLKKIGQGPGEYATLADFNVTEEGIFLLDFGAKILHYNHNLEYVKKIDHNILSFSFISKKNKFWLYNESSPGFPINLVSFIDNGKTVKEFFPQTNEDLKNNWMGSNEFQLHNSNLYFSPRFGNSIFLWNKNKWDKLFTISFGDKTFMGDVNSLENIYGYLLRKYFFMVNDYIVVSFPFNRHIHYSFYNRNTKEIISGKIQNDLIPNYGMFFPKWNSGKKLIECVDASDVLNEFRVLVQFDSSLQNLTEDDNPVLVLYEFK